MYKEDYNDKCFIDKYTYNELRKAVVDEHESCNYNPEDPTFKMFVLSSMKEGQVVEINEYLYTYEFISPDCI